MNTISIYSSLPYWLQNIAVSLHGCKLQLTDDIIRLMAERLNQNYRPKVNYNNNRNNNPRRRY